MADRLDPNYNGNWIGRSQTPHGAQFQFSCGSNRDMRSLATHDIDLQLDVIVDLHDELQYRRFYRF